MPRDGVKIICNTLDIARITRDDPQVSGGNTLILLWLLMLTEAGNYNSDGLGQPPFVHIGLARSPPRIGLRKQRPKVRIQYRAKKSWGFRYEGGGWAVSGPQDFSGIYL